MQSKTRDRISTLIQVLLPRSAVKKFRSLTNADRRTFLAHLRGDDAFLVGHPKSGNTWLAYMLAVLLEDKVGGKLTLANVKDYIPAVHDRDKLISRSNNLPSPRVFRNEGPRYPEFYPRTIYIVRDPRAAYVSYYHHCVHDTGETDWSMEAFVHEMLQYGCIKRLEPFLKRWDWQVSFWLDRASRQPVKFVRYEDLKSDCEGELRGVIDFLGMSCSDEKIAEAIDRGSFKSMRRDEVTHGAEPYSGDKGGKGFFTRKGEIDGWKTELSPDLAADIEAALREPMQRLGYL